MSNRRKRILIVDDDISLGEVLQQALKYLDHSYEVRMARDADEALAQISRRPFDLLITDIKMEGLSGLQLLEAMRHVAPDTRTVAMTAFASADIEARARRLGVYAYLNKPFTVQEFRNLINDALEAEEAFPLEKLPPSQSQSLNKTLADLRANTGVQAAFFIEEQTANVLGVASDVNDLDLTSLAKALVDITHRMTAEVAKVFGGDSGFQRSQYVGETFNLSAYRLAGKGLLIVVYGHHVKEGLISFYARQTLERLAQVLQEETSSETSNGDRVQDRTSPETSLTSSHPATSESTLESESDLPSEPLSLEQALARGLLNDDFFKSLGEET